MNSYSRSSRTSGGNPVRNLQSAAIGEPDYREVSLQWLATTTKQLTTRAEAAAHGLRASLARRGPVWVSFAMSRLRLVQAVLRQVVDDQHALARYVAHLGVLVMVLAMLPFGRIELSEAVGAAPPQARDALEQGRLILAAWTQPAPSDEGYMLNAIVPHTTVAEPDVPALDGAIIDPGEDFPRRGPGSLTSDVARVREDVITYSVRDGDTPYDIADRFGISLDTVIWANPSLQQQPPRLSIGQQLVILPVSGVYHTVAKGETIQSIAKKYAVDPAAIIAAKINQLRPDTPLQIGQKLIVPGGQKPGVAKVAAAGSQPSSGPRVSSSYNAPVPADAAKGAGTFAWPVGGSISQRFRGYHPAIDIATRTGSPVVAADAGFVVYAGWTSVGYGNMVLVDHGNGFRTLYGHMSQILVQSGQSVARGDLIGKVGCTGRCSGPHLHLEIIQNGVKRNPFNFLP